MAVLPYWLLFALRLAFGALFVFAGLNEFLHYWTPPAPITPQSQAFMAGLAGSGFVIPLLGMVYTLCGLALLANRFVALALVVLAAPTVMIVGYHAVMERHLLSPGLVVLAAHLLLAWAHRRELSVLFLPRPAPAAAS